MARRPAGVTDPRRDPTKGPARAGELIMGSPATVRLDVKKGDVLQLLVENLGRVDFSLALKDQVKGIVGDVKIGNEILKGWATYSLPISQLPSLLNKTVSAADTPVFYTGSFILPDGTETDQSGDILLTFPKGIKGQVWVNGINMGRYWTIGPQQSLYIPGCYVKDHAMSNDVVVLELEPKAGTELTGKGVATREWFNSPDPDAP
ncbi:glycoside hydrolase family 35 [Purpureocillium lilacinum]|uniref:Glycoside hydrolase family 35 n=1 Tax=Purpureocillium lilacinum TaxID=33203 RepID=A0A179F7J6_PURLI|nr:glycoside hydrolase family 35 [Purpureocillium lilacinum]OAQ61310.1 glycoside hydrolase family 35 [Purpureocillium lilacinum]